MTTYDNDMSGALFKNKKKEEGDKKPEYTGQCEINGQEMWISAWVKESARGKFFSMRFTPKEEMQKPTPKRSLQSAKDDVDAMMDDDLPPF